MTVNMEDILHRREVMAALYGSNNGPTIRDSLADYDWMLAHIVDLLGQIAALSFAICPDGTITGTEDLVEWAAELQYAMTKLSTITETEAAMRARIAALEGQLSQTQAALRWALVSVRPWDEEDWYRDGKLTERLICRYCMMYQTGWFDNAPNTHTTACPYRKAVELAHTQTAPATEPPNGAS